MREVNYAMAPITVLDLLQVQRARAGDIEAVIDLIERRTDLAKEEILGLQEDEVISVMAKISEAMDQGKLLKGVDL